MEGKPLKCAILVFFMIFNRSIGIVTSCAHWLYNQTLNSIQWKGKHGANHLLLLPNSLECVIFSAYILDDGLQNCLLGSKHTKFNWWNTLHLWTHTHTLDRAKKQKQQTRTSSRRPMFLIKLYTFAECAHTHWILSERIFEWVVPWCHYLLLVFYFIFRIVPYCLCAVVVYVASVCHFQTIKFPIKNSTEIHMVDRKVTQMNGENEILVWLDEAPYKNDTIK